MPRRRRFPSSTGVNRTGLVALRTSGASLGGSSRARPMSIGPDRWHSSHLRCVALFNVVFVFSTRAWASLTRRGAVYNPPIPISHPCVWRIARRPLRACASHATGFHRSANASCPVRSFSARRSLVLVSSGVSHVASATPSCPEVGTPLGRACLRARFARWGGGRSRHRLCVHLRRSLALVSLVVFGLSRRSGVRPRGEWGGGCRWAGWGSRSRAARTYFGVVSCSCWSSIVLFDLRERACPAPAVAFPRRARRSCRVAHVAAVCL